MNTLIQAASFLLLLLPGCMPAATHAQVKTEPEKVVKPAGPFKPDREQDVKGISVEAVAKSNLVETLRSVIGDNGELTWSSKDGKPHVIDNGDTTITLTSGTKIRFDFSEKNGLFTFESPRPNVSVATGPFRLNAPAVSVLFKPDNSAEATADVGFGIKKTKTFKISWDNDTPAPTPTQTSQPVQKRIVVWCYTTPGCGPCQQAKDALSAASLPFDVDWSRQPPSWVTSFPTFHWQDSSGSFYKCVGWVGVSRLTEMVVGKPQASLERPIGRGVTWHYSGGDDKSSLVEHLLRDGIHRGKWPKSYLESLSRDALVRLHSNDHNSAIHN